jgi:hypothetical protein
MDLEVTVNGQDVVCRVIEDPEEGPAKDDRCEWASKLETRAREVFGKDPNRIVFRYYNQGIRLSVDNSSKAAVMQAIREELGNMPVQVQAFSLDIMRILERG